MRVARQCSVHATLAVLALAAAAVSAEVVRGPYLQLPSPDSMMIRWATDVPTDSRVRYGSDPLILDQEVTVPLPRVDHRVTLTGLEPDTRYWYAVGSSAGDESSGDSHTFTTAPLPGSTRPIRIWTFGDSGEASNEQAAVREAYEAWAGDDPADLLLLLGDNAYQAGTQIEYDEKFFRSYPETLASAPVFSTLGNHEGLSSRRTDQGGQAGVEAGPYFDLFSFPTAGESGGFPSNSEAFYSFDYGNLHVICLDSESADRDAGGMMATWLAADLAANDAEWTIAIFHHPVYSFGGHNSDDDELDVVATGRVPDLRQVFLPMLEDGGVDLVLMGHSHSYERSFLISGHYGFSDSFDPSMKLDGGSGTPFADGPYRKTGDPANDADTGTVYAVVGSAESVTAVAGLHPAMYTFETALGSMVIDIEGARLDARFIDLNQDVLDHFAIVRGLGNIAPTAIDDSAGVSPAGSVVIDLLANDYDADGDLVMVSSVDAPTLGSLVDHGDGTITYQADSQVPHGVDRFEYTITDGLGNFDTATVTVTISCPPLLDGVFFEDVEPTPEAGWTFDTPHNELLSPTWAPVEDAAARSPSHSWFSVSDEGSRLKDDRLVSPPLDLTSESTLTFWHRYHTEQNFDGGSLEISTNGGLSWRDLGDDIVTGGYDGAVTLTLYWEPGPAWTGNSGPDMSFVEVDLSDWAGENRLIRWRLRADDFTFEGTEGWWLDDIRVDGMVGTTGVCNLPPVAVNDEVETSVDTPVQIDALANDSDPDGDVITLYAVADPAHGSARIATGDVIDYTPDPGFVGVDVFEYSITDGEFEATAAITVEVDNSSASGATAKGNGEILDVAGRARIAFHVKPNLKNAWFRYRGGVEIDGDPTSLTVTGSSAVVEGSCETDGGACTFSATAFDGGQPGNQGDSFEIEIRDESGALLWQAAGPVDRGGIRIR